MVTTAAGPATTADEQVNEAVEQLLRDHPPASTDAQAFWGAQFDLGLAWVHFPQGRGGLGLDPDLQQVVDDRLRRAGAPDPMLRNFMGLGMLAPTLVAFGTGEQQHRHLRPAFTCAEIWCQMFSEPGAGSDVASLATRAVRDGDEWVVHGQKVWTTLAHVADFGMLLARTDPEVPKHQGLTYFLCDMRQPGVDVRPLRQMTGEAEFNEIFLSGARIPDSQRVGAVGDGWRVAIGTLMNERVALGALAKEDRGGGVVRHAVRLVQEHGGDAVARDRLVRRWIEAEVVRLTTLRAQSAREQGTPGPEGSILKLAVGGLQQRIFELCVDALGAHGMLIGDYEMRRPTIMGESSLAGDEVDLVKAFLAVQGTTIGGGTTDIGRNILGERVLGLPGEPRTDRDLPWSQVPRS
jgi:alkylation response protein AidB-like acyl-CoA dehydrogenase